MKRILAFVLSALMVVCVLASCNNTGTKTDITVKVTVENDGEVMYPEQSVTLTKTEDYIPTVLDAVVQFLEDNGAEYETDTFAGHDIIKSIDGVTKTNDQLWQVLIDGEEPAGRYAALAIAEGNVITFVYGKSLSDTETETEAVTTEDKKPVQTADDGYEA